MKSINFTVIRKSDNSIWEVVVRYPNGNPTFYLKENNRANFSWVFMADFISCGQYRFYNTPKDVQKKVMELCMIASL